MDILPNPDALSAAAGQVPTVVAGTREPVLPGDNTYLARLRHLWLTTVDNASHDVGRRAAQCLLDRIADPARPGELVLAAPELKVRGTTAPPPDRKSD